MAKRKLKLKRKFSGKQYEFVGSRGTKTEANKWAKFVRKRGKNARIVKDGKDGLWLIYERKRKR